jgi:hypothetical protein
LTPKEAGRLAATERDQGAIGEVVARYQLDIDFTTIPTLAEQHNLRLGEPNQPTGHAVPGRLMASTAPL